MWLSLCSDRFLWITTAVAAAAVPGVSAATEAPHASTKDAAALFIGGGLFGALLLPSLAACPCNETDGGLGRDGAETAAETAAAAAAAAAGCSFGSLDIST